MGKCVSIESNRKFKKADAEPEPAHPSWRVAEDPKEHWDKRLKESRRRDAERYGGKLPYRPWYEY